MLFPTLQKWTESAFTFIKTRKQKNGDAFAPPLV